MGPRNLGVAPCLSGEGYLVQPLKVPQDVARTSDWHVGMSPFDRIHYHQTLSSVRRYAHFKPLPGLIPSDSLDITLTAEYDHGTDQFGEKVDVVLQGSTMGSDLRRRLRNTVDISKEADAVSAAVVHSLSEKKKTVGFGGSVFGNTEAQSSSNRQDKKKKHERYNEFHLVHIGGIKERRHPSNMKLMHSSHHSPQTNAGYSRQSDGNTYQY